MTYLAPSSPSLHRIIARRLTWAATIIVASGCLAEYEEVDENAQSSGCPITLCGVNTATTNPIPYGRLHLEKGQNTGLVSDNGYQITDFLAPEGQDDYILRARKGRLTASNGIHTLSGAALVDSTIVITDTVTGDVTELVVKEHDRMATWTDAAFDIDRYVLATYDADTDSYVSICEEYDVPRWSVIVSDELYDWDTIRVADTSVQNSRGWFNISCADHALYKLKMTGHDPRPSNNNPYRSKAKERQAMLKMITADYCGTGTTFTEDGTELHWRNHAGWSHNNPPQSSDFEAFWDENGALCLDTPRLGSELMESIQAECASVGKTLPTCAGFTGKYLWKTAIPTAP